MGPKRSTWILRVQCQESEPSLPDQERRKRWAELFDQLDLNKDGRIDILELRAGLAGRGLSKGSLERLVKAGDINQDGVLDFEEFIQYLRNHEKQLKVIFRHVDKNNDGQIDAAEIRDCLHTIGVNISFEDATRILLSMDRDGTMTIDWTEWRDHFLFNPLDNMEDVARFWKRSMILDTGEQLTVPEEFSEEEKKSGYVWRQLMAGVVAGSVSRTGTAPLDRLKVFRQVHGSSDFKGNALSGFQYMLKEGGPWSLWRGNGVNVLKIAPETAIKFTAYEQTLKLAWLKRNRGLPDPGVMVLVGCGAVSSTCGMLASYPLALIRTRMQAQASLKGAPKLSMLSLLHNIVTQEGLAGLYRGISPNLLKIIPAVSVSYVVYEYMRMMLGVDIEGRGGGKGKW
ncbi:calcium-binding mitochondrial carrier protein SCaMC-1 isoform X4 [Girardinichthys multiradiatus]|uniref:calcium-binding mitochondrial carrier protein SCaMC-1 isoform X4 n=1 Tax=Girardinichthys multiradiatus TaxID=208333 RepID=UPI001FAC22ED|nr:calcium-binding mitochondrial carrier protein SCaMC-1 isoform X4 [Girardinichthys multiradiatus]